MITGKRKSFLSGVSLRWLKNNNAKIPVVFLYQKNNQRVSCSVAKL